MTRLLLTLIVLLLPSVALAADATTTTATDLTAVVACTLGIVPLQRSLGKT